MLRTYSDVHTPYDYKDVFKATQITEDKMNQVFGIMDAHANMIAFEKCKDIEDEVGALQEAISDARFVISGKLHDIFIKIARESCE